jgi:TRAP transporter 4TM/12TM fusion protein
MGESNTGKKDIYNTIAKYYRQTVYIITGLVAIWVAGFGSMSDMNQRAGLVTFLCPTVFTLKPLLIGKEKRSYWWTKLLDVILTVATIAGGTYMLVAWPSKMLKASAFTSTDIVMGWIMLICMLEATRRATGLVVSLTALVFLLYMRFGYIFDGVLGHRGESWERIISTIYVSTEGLFGSSVGVAASYIILFVVFGAFLEAFGTGQWFVDFSFSLTGRYRGGPAKTAIVSSGLMGMISGASVANVVTTGSFTIPLMKKMGYEPHEAGAIEAVASTGGMLMPPIMGSAAFLMADFLGVRYGEIARAAAIPAVLYYFALILVADAIAVRRNLHGLPKEELPSMRNVMKDRGLFVIPILLLIFLILMGYSAMKSCVYSIFAILLVACFRKNTRPTLKTILKALADGAGGAMSIVCTCSIAGIIVCAISLTGLGTKASASLIALAGGNLYIGALIAAIICIILGCGMPCAAVYIILASILSKPLIDMGALPLAAHMLIFYFSCIGTITPPVAITAYTGAAIAQANPNKTGFAAFRYGAVAYIIPFFCLVNPTLLLIGNIPDIILSCITAVFGTICLVGALEGFFLVKFNALSRVILGAAALLTLMPGWKSDAVGVACAVIAYVITTRCTKRQTVSTV